MSCAQPKEDRLGDDLQLDAPDARFDRIVRVIEEPSVVALQAVGRVERCGTAEWLLAFDGPNPRDQASAAEQGRLLCHVPMVPDDSRCAEGGPFWYYTDPTVDGTGGDGRSAIWVESRGPEPDWRADPVEVVAREVAWAQQVAPFYRLRRVGLQIVDRSEDRVVIDAIHQNVTPNGENGQTFGSDQRERYGLTRIAGRSGWYEDDFIIVKYSRENLDFGQLDAAWPDQLDRIVVDVDRR